MKEKRSLRRLGRYEDQMEGAAVGSVLPAACSQQTERSVTFQKIHLPAHNVCQEQINQHLHGF
jgi:hypothetical protein